MFGRVMRYTFSRLTNFTKVSPPGTDTFTRVVITKWSVDAVSSIQTRVVQYAEILC